jgi:Polyketide synthase modules and related proteins
MLRNGRTPGIVQPSVEGQKAVIRAAYRRAGLGLGDTDYVEVGFTESWQITILTAEGAWDRY